MKKQKGESQNGGNKKTKRAKFSEKRTFLPPNSHSTYVYQGVRNVRFTENLARFVLLLPPFCDSPFCIIIDDLYEIGQMERATRTRVLSDICCKVSVKYLRGDF